MPKAYLTRVVEFTATHRFPDTPEFSGATDDHSHRYRCSVTVKGVFDPTRGGVMSLPALKALLQREVVARFDGRHINQDLAPRVATGEHRKRVLASGCGAVATMLADPETMSRSAPLRGEPPAAETLRALFKQLFAAGARYNETGGIHAAALTDGATLLFHAEDIGRHNAVDKVIGGAVLARTPITGRGLLVTGRISAELAFKAARAGVAWVATPSVPSTLAVTIADRSGMVLVGRAVSGTPHVHKRDA